MWCGASSEARPPVAWDDPIELLVEIGETLAGGGVRLETAARSSFRVHFRDPRWSNHRNGDTDWVCWGSPSIRVCPPREGSGRMRSRSHVQQQGRARKRDQTVRMCPS